MFPFSHSIHPTPFFFSLLETLVWTTLSYEHIAFWVRTNLAKRFHTQSRSYHHINISSYIYTSKRYHRYLYFSLRDDFRFWAARRTVVGAGVFLLATAGVWGKLALEWLCCPAVCLWLTADGSKAIRGLSPFTGGLWPESDGSRFIAPDPMAICWSSLALWEPDCPRPFICTPSKCF